MELQVFLPIAHTVLRERPDGWTHSEEDRALHKQKLERPACHFDRRETPEREGRYVASYKYNTNTSNGRIRIITETELQNNLNYPSNT